MLENMQYIKMEMEISFVLQYVHYQDYWKFYLPHPLKAFSGCMCFRSELPQTIVASCVEMLQVIAHAFSEERALFSQKTTTRTSERLVTYHRATKLVNSVESYWKLKSRFCIFSMTFPNETAKPNLRRFVYTLLVFIFFSVKLVKKWVHAHQVWLT